MSSFWKHVAIYYVTCDLACFFPYNWIKRHERLNALFNPFLKIYFNGQYAIVNDCQLFRFERLQFQVSFNGTDWCDSPQTSLFALTTAPAFQCGWHFVEFASKYIWALFSLCLQLFWHFEFSPHNRTHTFKRNFYTYVCVQLYLFMLTHKERRLAEIAHFASQIYIYTQHTLIWFVKFTLWIQRRTWTVNLRRANENNKKNISKSKITEFVQLQDYAKQFFFCSLH